MSPRENTVGIVVILDFAVIVVIVPTKEKSKIKAVCRQ